MYDPTNTGHHDLRGPWYQGPNRRTERTERENDDEREAAETAAREAAR